MDDRAPQAKDMYIACLQALRDLGGTATAEAITKTAAEVLQLTHRQRTRVDRQDKQGRDIIAYEYNIRWTLTFLKKIDYVFQPQHKYHALTDRARQSRLSNQEVHHLVTKMIKGERKHTPRKIKEDTTATPRIDNNNNIDKLLKHLHSLNRKGQQLEIIVKQLLELMDEYHDPETTQATNDGGIDLIAYFRDRFSGEMEKVLIQVKNYRGTKISNKEIRNLRGSRMSADRFWFITTSDFTPQAKEEARKSDKQKAVRLTNGVELARMLIEYNVGLKHIYPLENEQPVGIQAATIKPS